MATDRRLALLMLPLLAGCTLGPDFQQPSPWSPASWFGRRQPPAMVVSTPTASVPVAEPINPRWWESFNDPELSHLVTRAAESNLDVKAATARLAQSRAQLRVAGADLYPQANGNASYTREQQSSKGVISLLGGSSGQTSQSNGLGGRQGGVPASSATSVPAFDLWQYGFDASWELDLWGRVHRSIESANATLEASLNARRDTMLSTLAEVARDYMQLRGAQETLRITHENLDSAQQSVGLTQERARAGLSTELDVANAQSQADSIAAGIPQLEQQQAQLINAIGLLVGEYPGALEAELVPPTGVPEVPALVPVGLPSELARRRPDIRQMEAQLHAATASIGAAKADFFPKITLSGSAGFQALQFKDLGNWGAGTYSFGPSISIPIFEGGRLLGTLALREAQQQEAAMIYQRTVLAAFRDVDDAITAYRAEQRRHNRLAASADSARRALDLANIRYKQGLSDYLEVLTAQRTLLGVQQQLANSTATIGGNLVALYKALGGGWEMADREPAAIPQTSVPQ